MVRWIDGESQCFLLFPVFLSSASHSNWDWETETKLRSDQKRTGNSIRLSLCLSVCDLFVWFRSIPCFPTGTWTSISCSAQGYKSLPQQWEWGGENPKVNRSSDQSLCLSICLFCSALLCFVYQVSLSLWRSTISFTTSFDLNKKRISRKHF